MLIFSVAAVFLNCIYIFPAISFPNLQKISSR